MGASTRRRILHADLDAFYASVEQHDNPTLRERPVAVLDPPRHGQRRVSSPSYEARACGITSDMPLEEAQRRCPDVVAVERRLDRYHQLSQRILRVFFSITPLVEPIGLDEAYLDVSEQVQGDSLEGLGRHLRARVGEETGLPITVGGGTSRVVAKVACNVAKPDGLLVVPEGEEMVFLSPLAVHLLPGIGVRTAGLLRDQGISTVGQLAQADGEWLGQTMGQRGALVMAWARGADTGVESPHGPRRSIDAEEDAHAGEVRHRVDLERRVSDLARVVARALQREALAGSSARLRLLLAQRPAVASQRPLNAPTSDEEVIASAALALAQGAAASTDAGIRSIRVGVGDLHPTTDPTYSPVW